MLDFLRNKQAYLFVITHLFLGFDEDVKHVFFAMGKIYCFAYI